MTSTILKTATAWSLLILAGVAFAPSVWAQRSAQTRTDKSSVERSSVDRISRSEISEIASEIDRLVQQKLESAGLSRNPRTTDEQFVRRVYLDIAGRIPTLEETKSFPTTRTSGQS